jgi:hypothetical protein
MSAVATLAAMAGGRSPNALPGLDGCPVSIGAEGE